MDLGWCNHAGAQHEARTIRWRISRHREITLDGVAKRVYVAGRGPAVIVMTEMPGISPHVARFARWVRDAGFAVYMPSLFGRDGAVPSAEEGVAVFQRACVSAEFRALRGQRSRAR